MTRARAPAGHAPPRHAAHARPAASEASALRRALLASQGQPLEAATRARFEGQGWAATAVRGASHQALESQAEAAIHGGLPGADFSQVRIHRDAHAQRAAALARARALTWGQDIYLGAAAGASGDALLRHELAHTLQQAALGTRRLQPRLIASGSAADIERFITMAEAAMGEDLQHDPVSGEITAVATTGPALSPVFAATLHRILDDPVQDAEAHFGTAQPRVAVGAFPQPPDMTGATEQLIDMDDVEAIESGAPGNGLGKLAHELTENYTAHGVAAVAGTNRFGPAHAAGLSAESDVAEDTVGPGRRVAGVDTPAVGNTFTRIQDFETYYLVFDLTRNPVDNDFSVSNARQAPRLNVSTRTIDAFVTGSAVLPATSAAAIAAAAAEVAATPSATVRIEGFTDTVGTPVGNVILSNQRAQSGLAALAAAGVAPGRMHAVGLGQTRPVAANDVEANRRRNRRIVITVDRPGP